MTIPLRVAVPLSAALFAVIGQQPDPFTRTFNVPRNELASAGRSAWFILEPGYASVLEGGGTKLVVTVLAETRMVDGVETRIVEEREADHGKLIEVSRNYFAIHPPTGDVYYFGESVDMYKDGRIVSHEGSWLSGVNGAHFGLLLPGKPMLGARFYQEIAPKVAMDRAMVASLSESLTTRAGRFSNCLKTEETTPLEPGAKEYKLYAKDVGLVQDGALTLVRYGRGVQ